MLLSSLHLHGGPHWPLPSWPGTACYWEHQWRSRTGSWAQSWFTGPDNCATTLAQSPLLMCKQYNTAWNIKYKYMTDVVENMTTVDLCRSMKTGQPLHILLMMISHDNDNQKHTLPRIHLPCCLWSWQKFISPSLNLCSQNVKLFLQQSNNLPVCMELILSSFQVFFDRK